MPAIPDVAPIGPGIVPTTLYNQLVAAIAFLLRPPIAELRTASAQSITSGTWTALQFDVDDIDSANGHDTAVNNTRYTAQYPGTLEVSGGYGPSSNAVGVRGTRFALNGTVVNASQMVVPAASLVLGPARVKKIPMNQGDYVEIQAFQSSGGNLAGSGSANEVSSFTIKFVSA